MIRMDFNTSGWTTPRRAPIVEANYDITSDLLVRRTERLLSATDGLSKARLGARRLEERVFKVASQKCSVEEVETLRNDIKEWLDKEEQTASLLLSAQLLNCILVNHRAHSDSSKNTKNNENSLKNKLDELEVEKDRVEDELQRQRALYTAKSQECQQLRGEISQLKALATTLGVASHDLPKSTPPAQLPTPPSTSPTPYSASQTPVSRFHSRSASMTPRPSTPAASPISPSRSHTPGLSSPTRTSSASAAAAAAAANRPPTPAHGLRSYTPAPAPSAPMPAMPTRYAATPSPTQMRHHTYTPAPLVPPKPRRLSTSTPQKLTRSMSEEKAEAHERWLPPQFAGHGEDKAPRSPSRMQGFSSAAYAASRLRDLGVASP
ncbi:hypothetical protein MD484_g2331, partial [Candolleomyces efflorescens]